MTEYDLPELDAEAPHHTPLRPVMAGSFRISRASIPFFVATMTLQEAVDELKLVENLPSDLRSKWRLEELFQREIDWRRVEHAIVNGYLRRPEKLQFFNSLTVALLPTTDQQQLERDYGPERPAPALPDALQRSPWKAERIGSIQLVRNPKQPLAYVSWDPKRIFPATIDGQHRLAALRLLHQAGNLTSEQLSTSISVLFLILDRRVGFQLDPNHVADDENPILTVVRELFIDLNRQAKEVVRSRAILLDDQEIESRCVRLLLAKRIGDRSTDRIPLGLVHWQHNVTAKFNSGKLVAPFITTSELLYISVRDLLKLRRPEDPNEEDDVRRFVASVENALDVSNVLAAAPPGRYQATASLMKYVDANYLREGLERPFANLPAQYLRVADDAFVAQWRPLFVRVLFEFEPYANFIKEVDRLGGIDGDLAFYLCLPTRAQKQQWEAWGESAREKIDKPLEELDAMKKADWPFFAVFQKALFRATARAWRQRDVIGPSGITSLDEFLNAWIAFLNTLWERKLLGVRVDIPGTTSPLWGGVALNPGSKTVKWNEASTSRIAALLYVWWVFHVQAYKRVSSFVGAIDKSGDSKFPEVQEALREVRKGLRSAVKATVEDAEDAEVDKLTEARLRDVIQVAIHDTAGTGDDD